MMLSASSRDIVLLQETLAALGMHAEVARFKLGLRQAKTLLSPDDHKWLTFHLASLYKDKHRISQGWQLPDPVLNPRYATLTCRVSIDEAARVQQQARIEGISISNYIRDRIL